MPCEHYKDALMELAASGAAPQGQLAVHIAECASCREAFNIEQSLFADIDSRLQVAANAEVPASLLPRVRVALSQVPAPRFNWVRPVVLVSASLVLAFAILLIGRPRRTSPESVARQGSFGPATTTPTTTTNPEKSPLEGVQVAAHAAHSHAARNSTNLHVAASSNPEVLVPPDEREAFARLVAVLNERSDVAAALVAKAPQKDAVVTADPLRIPGIEIKPLEGTETESSDGAGDKR
ncbi:MAG TPA: hypothetical protein VKB90_14510 [Candidatus Acidoferrum sp.]|nr:hypothetical protein [Candidatus Acidoferrum sp.]